MSSNTDRDETIRNMQAAVQRRTLRMLGHLRASTVAASTVAANDSRVGVALIGYGAIGSVVAEAIISGQAGPTKLAAVLVARERSTRPPELPTDCYFGTDLDGFFSAEWDICVEAAGQPTVGAMAARCLAAERSIVLTSIGALADSNLLQRLERVANEANMAAIQRRSRPVQLLLCTGSLLGVDWCHAASLAGVSSVQITQTKPPRAWKGTPAEQELDLDALNEDTTVFEGAARAATMKYPKNANVAACFAIATAGLDDTRVRLVAAPGAKGNQTQVQFDGPAGTATVEVEGRPSQKNPRTSSIVPLAVVKALKNLTSPVFIGV